MSSRKDNSFTIRIQPTEYVYVQVPIEKRELKKPTSFTMPPSVTRKITEYAKRHRMSKSDFVTLLCVSFFENVGRLEKGIESNKGIKGQEEPERKL